MRLLLFFDLPMETKLQRRRYSRFRKFLINNGFIMMQKSVYSRLIISNQAYKAVFNDVSRHRPPEGLVQILKVTEKQFASIATICGEVDTCYVDSMEELIVI